MMGFLENVLDRNHLISTLFGRVEEETTAKMGART